MKRKDSALAGLMQNAGFGQGQRQRQEWATNDSPMFTTTAGSNTAMYVNAASLRDSLTSAAHS